MDRCPLCGHDDLDHAADCPDAHIAPTRSVFVDPDAIARARAVLAGETLPPPAPDAPAEPEPPAYVAAASDDADVDSGWDDDWGEDWHDDDAWEAFTGETVAATDPPPSHDDDNDAVGAVAAVPVAAATDDPLSIPIREPGVTSERAARPPMDSEQRRLLALVGGGLALLVLAVVGALIIGGDDGVASDAEVAGSVLDGSDVTGDAAGADDDEPDPTDPPTTATTASTVAETTTTVEATTTTTSTSTTTTTAAPVSSDTGDVPVLTPGQIGRGWVAQVTSVPQRSGGEALQRAYAVVEADAPSAVAIRSDDWPALRSGFWVIVIPGYDTGADALAGCRANAQGDDCQGRFLSSNAAQNARVCTRGDDGSPRGDCGA